MSAPVHRGSPRGAPIGSVSLPRPLQRNRQKVCPVTFQVCLPFPNTFYGFFVRWICEIKPKILGGNVPSGVPGSEGLKLTLCFVTELDKGSSRMKSGIGIFVVSREILDIQHTIQKVSIQISHLVLYLPC